MTTESPDDPYVFTQHRVRDFPEVLDDLRRIRERHVTTAHHGDASACRCELLLVDADEDIVSADLLEDIDGNPAGVDSLRRPITGARWRAPKQGDSPHE